MRKKKNIAVQRLIESVNAQNAGSTCSPEVRAGWNSLLENVLHETGNYRGFSYLNEFEVPKGQLPGIRLVSPVQWNHDGSKIIAQAVREFPDESRRRYY